MAQLEYKSSDAIRDSEQLNTTQNNLLEIYKEVDAALVEEKIAIGKIKLKMLIFNTIMILLLLALVIFNYKKFSWMENAQKAEDLG